MATGVSGWSKWSFWAGGWGLGAGNWGWAMAASSIAVGGALTQRPSQCVWTAGLEKWSMSSSTFRVVATRGHALLPHVGDAWESKPWPLVSRLCVLLGIYNTDSSLEMWLRGLSAGGPSTCGLQNRLGTVSSNNGFHTCSGVLNSRLEEKAA